MQNPFFDVYRAGLRNTADLLADQARWLQEFSEVRTLEELIALQSRFAMSFWSGFARAGERQLLATGGQLGQVREVVSTSTSIESALQERAA